MENTAEGKRPLLEREEGALLNGWTPAAASSLPLEPRTIMQSEKILRCTFRF